MKKALIVIVLMVGAAIVMSSVAMAQQLDQKPILVSANVAKYAGITVTAQPMAFGTFTGVPNQEKERDNAVFSVETNTALNLRFSGGDLTKGSSYLETRYVAYRNSDGEDLGYFNRDAAYGPIVDLVVLNGQAAKTTKSYSVVGWAHTGPNISSQEAGDYSATITLTVSAP